jgi:hypothetical protein
MAREKRWMSERKHKRFKVQDSAFVVLGTSPGLHSTKVGQIADMSMDGLAFSYIAEQKPSNGSFELGIFLADNSFQDNHVSRYRERQ